MDLRQLRYFVTLARQQHFGRTANVLHIAQPALTRQIKLLEHELGVQLFERHARGATPTEEGRLLLERGSFLLKYAEQLMQDMSTRQRNPQGRVAIGMSPGLALVLAAPLTQALRDRYPEVMLQIYEGFTDILREQLLQGVVDLAILNGATAVRHLTTTPLMKERICLVGLADQARGGPTSRIEDLAGLPLILPGVPKSGVRLLLEAAAANADVTLNTLVEVHSVEVSRRLVLQGLGHTVHFAGPLKPDIEAGVFYASPIEGLELTRFIARASEHPPSQATIALSEVLREIVDTLVQTGEWPHVTLL